MEEHFVKGRLQMELGQAEDSSSLWKIRSKSWVRVLEELDVSRNTITKSSGKWTSNDKNEFRNLD